MSGGFGGELNEQGKIEVSIVCAGHRGRLASLNLNGKHSKPTWQPIQ